MGNVATFQRSEHSRCRRHFNADMDRPNDTSPRALAEHFMVEDIPSAMIAGTRINGVLQSLAIGRPLAAGTRAFLADRGLGSLLQCSDGLVTQAQFAEIARAERDERRERTMIDLASNQDRQAAAATQQVAMWAELEQERLKRESDPRFIANQVSRELRSLFGVDRYVKPPAFKRLMPMLRKLNAGLRITEDDVVWLTTEGRDYATWEIMRVHNRLEADFFISEYTRTKNAWNAVNASGHLRKCDASAEAHALLSEIPANRLVRSKLRSAIFTTHGGALRDLQKFDEALTLGEKAHELTPNNFRPCTLLGAVNIELGRIEAGDAWYRKAERLGARADNIESDLRSVLARMSPDQRKQIVDKLLTLDSVQYAWLRRPADTRSAHSG